jgi:histidine triad (HIT) family protein
MDASWHGAQQTPNVTDCVFCRIVEGEPAHRVWEDAASVAFLDTRPVFPGHTLVVPRRHVETLVDLSPGDVAPFFGAVRTVTRAVEQGMSAGGSFVAINNRVSQSVPHLHCHVIPRTKGDGLRGFFWPRQKYDSEDEAAAVAARIRAAVGPAEPQA